MKMLALRKGNVEIGALKLRDRKKRCLYITDGHSYEVFGTFTNEDCAERFMDKLSEFVGAKRAEE